MNPEEIQDILSKMGALQKDENEKIIGIDMNTLMGDPIVSNRLGVELIQRLPPNYKFEAIVTPAGDGTYFGYATAMAAWARFVIADYNDSWLLHHDQEIRNKEKVIVLYDKTWDDDLDALLEYVESLGGKIAGVLLPFLTEAEPIKSYPVCGLW